MYPPFTPIFQHDTNATYNFSWIDSLASCPPSTAWRPATAMDTFQTFQLSVDVVLVSVLCLFGFIGNVLTIVTLRDDVKNKKNTTNWLLQVKYFLAFYNIHSTIQLYIRFLSVTFSVFALFVISVYTFDE